jgi:4-diphosphocytidyl-2-C-methyl-D-erythritol kinase
LIYFPTAKINLGLKVLEKREDGFHNIESIFLPTQLYDILEVHKLDNGANGELKFACSGVQINCDINNNTVVRAHKLLSEKFELPALEASLQKFIPTGSGLGGGSADGSFMLKAINEICQLGLSISSLEKFAAELGSDCPFFVKNTPAIVTGRGESLNPITIESDKLRLKDIMILIIHPNIHVNTSSAFSWLKDDKEINRENDTPLPVLNSNLKKQDFSDLINTPIENWNEIIVNDFQEPVTKRFAQINKALNLIEDSNADYIQMTGSGAAVYGIFKFKKTRNSVKDSKSTQNTLKVAEKARKQGFFAHFGALA